MKFKKKEFFKIKPFNHLSLKMPYYAPQDDDDDMDFESKFNIIVESKNNNWDNMIDVNDLHGTAAVTDSKSSGSTNKK